MKKTLLIGLGLMLLSACLYSKKLDHPLMDNPAFKIIGDQGIKQDITLDELQGDYDCTLWLLDENDKQVGANEMDCFGKIKDTTLTIMWQMVGLHLTYKGLDYSYKFTSFKLERGLLFSEEEDPLLICAVKVYPDGHMIDCIGTHFQDDDTKLRIHFQMTK